MWNTKTAAIKIPKPSQTGEEDDLRLSQSMGDYSRFMPTRRHESDASTIRHQGYLLKRSTVPTRVTPTAVVGENLPKLPQPAASSLRREKTMPEDHLEFTGMLFGSDVAVLLSNSPPVGSSPKPVGLRHRREEPGLAPDDEPQPFYNGFARLSSAPLSRLNSEDMLPGERWDEQGHQWKPKFCVIENGILYFYRNEQEAESPQAREERHAIEGDLSRSLANSPNPMPADDGIDHVYEKRVALDCVGAVRSSNAAEHSFELLADVNEEEKLVLQAHSAEDMREWLFQFHRGIAFFVQNIIERQVNAARTLDLATSHVERTAKTLDSQKMLPYCSPKLYKRTQSPTLDGWPLSHGHGRSLQNRPIGRTQSLSSSPESPMTPFAMDASSVVTPLHPGYPSPPHPRPESLSPEETLPPEVSGPPAPENDLPPRQDTSGNYIPPFRRRMMERQQAAPSSPSFTPVAANKPAAIEEPVLPDGSLPKLGGCADPRVMVGSVSDERYKMRKAEASKVGKVASDPYGFSKPTYEVGAVSECGVRDSNEDAYLISPDLSHGWPGTSSSVWQDSAYPVMAIFDGHCGNQAARFAAERLTSCIYATLVDTVGPDLSFNEAEHVLREAIVTIDRQFCDMCSQDGRDWVSGATALVAVLIRDELMIANLGDARGVLCRSIATTEHADSLSNDGWTELPNEDHTSEGSCLWKVVTDVHSPGRIEERERIEQAGGWVTSETEIPGVAQLKRMDFVNDHDVFDILRRCNDGSSTLSPRAAAPQRMIEIFRVCGDLAVSRAIGDWEYKAAFNPMSDDEYEDGWLSAFMNRTFRGDLVSNTPDVKVLPVGSEGVSEEFLVLACDGLWDVMDPDDAVRVTRKLMFDQGWTAKRAAARLAELAMHLGSSDNITVIVVRFEEKSQ